MELASSLRNPVGRRTRSRKRNLSGRRLRLQAERLEDRLMLARITWIGGSGDWDSGINWSNGTGPGPADDAVIDVAGVAVTHSTGSHTVQSLTMNDPFTLAGGTLIVTGNLVEQNTNTFTMTGGTLRSATVVGEGGAVLAAAGGTLDGVTLGGTIGGVPTAAIVRGSSSFSVTRGPTVAASPPPDLGTQMLLNGGPTLWGGGENRRPARGHQVA